MSKDRKKVDEVVGREQKAWALWGITIGMLLIVAATVMPLLGSGPVFRWVYAGGAALLLVSRIFSPYTGQSIRLRRLYRLESWSALFFCIAVFFMFYDPFTRDWLAFTMAGGAIQIYTSLMIPRVARQEINGKDK